MSLQPGAQFGRYEMVSRLSRGGMAETYRARLMGEAGVTKPVLIKKVLPEHADDRVFSSMFVSEARISASLSHGNIAQVYDFGRVDGEYFLAMEYVDGQPLNRIIKRALQSGLTSIPIPLALYIGIEMCRGLHYAHTRVDHSGQPLGIVHRDISPDNVIISYEGQVKIVDFGIAKARELRGFNTEPGVVKGKFLYSSPEQARGREVDARTDVWATGIVLYGMLCGQLPVQGPQYLAVRRLVKGEFPRPREINPNLPEDLEDILLQALAVDREQRLASCHELGDALAGFLYSTEPRLSSLALSRFVQQLFRDDLAAEGRQVQIPGSFLKQMGRWQGVEETAHPLDEEVAPELSTPEPDTASEEVAPASMSARKALYLGLGVVTVITMAALVLLLVMESEPRLQAEDGPLALRPIEQTGGRTETPRRESIPAVADPAPPQAPAQAEPSEAEQAEVAPVREEPQRPPASSARKPRLRPSSGEQARVAYKNAAKLLRARKYELALSEASRCVELNPGAADCHMIVGATYASMHNWNKAADQYRKFLALAPDHPLAPKVRQTLENYDRSWAQ